MNRMKLVAVFLLACVVPAATKEPAKSNQPAKTQPHAAAPAVTPDSIVSSLVQGNQRFVTGKLQAHDYSSKRSALVAGQHPGAIVLSCSDSRVAPELVLDQDLGDIFVVRTAGNVADKVALGSMEYAVEHLGSKVLIIMGHEKCGAVSATLAGGDLPSDNLKELVARIEPGLAGHKSDLHEAVEANVRASADVLLKNSAILREKVESGELKIVKAVYQLDSGKVVLLD